MGTTNLDTLALSGSLTVGGTTIVDGVVTDITEFDAAVTFNDDITLDDGVDIETGTSSGTKIGTGATQKLGMYGATPVVQKQAAGVVLGFTAGSGDPVLDDSTFTGNIGTEAYTIGDIVAALKLIGIIKS